MQSLDIEENKFQDNPNLNKVPHFTGESRVMMVALSASLGFLSMGYHLSILNSSSIFLWRGCQYETDFQTFRSFADLFLTLTASILSGIFAFNKIKFPFYRGLLYVADFLTIIGTLMAFTIISTESTWIYFGRIVVGFAIGIDIAFILPFIREVQFYISESTFKAEKRRFFAEFWFTLGIFFGLLPAHFSSQIGKEADYTKIEQGDQTTSPQSLSTRPSIWVCYGLCVIPILAACARIILLTYIGDVKPPQYAPVFSDEGLNENFDGEDTERLSMFKFKETKSLLKLLQDPYRLRLELCYILHFVQVVGGFVIFIINSAYVSNYLKEISPDSSTNSNVQYTVLLFGSIYLVVSVLTSLLLTVFKIPRKKLLGFGNILSIIFAFLLVVFSILGIQSFIKPLMMLYWTSACIGLGPALELVIEEVIPSKGLQFLFALKWLLISIFGLLSKITLRYQMTYIPLFIFFITIGAMGAFAIFDLMPETAGVDPKEIYKLFEYEEEFLSQNDTRSDSLTSSLQSESVSREQQVIKKEGEN